MTKKQDSVQREETDDVSDDDMTPNLRHHQRSMSIEDINDDDDATADDTTPQTTPRTCPMRRSGSLRDDRLLYMSRYQNNEFRSDDGMAAPRMREGIGYSPTLSGGRKDDEPKHQRRIKLGTKAADLFAKLEMRLSNKKRGDSDGAASGS